MDLACLHHESLRSKIAPKYFAEVLQGMWWLLNIRLGGCLLRFEKKTPLDLVSLRLKPPLVVPVEKYRDESVHN